MHWWMPVLPRGTGQAHSLSVPAPGLEGSRHGAEQLKGTAGGWAGACPPLTAPLPHHLLGLCLAPGLQPSGPGAPVVTGTLAGELAWSKAWPCPVQPLGREGVSSSPLVLGTACQPSNRQSLKS